MEIIKPKRVKITKLQGRSDKIKPGYWVDGVAILEPKEGQPYLIDPVNRTSNNDRFDWFHTSLVKDFDGKVITTANSKWSYEEISS